MEVRCPGCATRYSIPDDKVRGRRGRFPCHRCGAKVIIDGTTLPPPSGVAPVPQADAAQPPARAGAASRPLPPVPRIPPRPISKAPNAQKPPASELSGADEEDEATRLVTSMPGGLPVFRSAQAAKPPASSPSPRSPPSPSAPAKAPSTELSDAIDEDEATRMVSIISTGPSVIPRPGNEDATIRAPLDGPDGLLAAIAAARKDTASAPADLASVDDDATRMLSAHASASPSSAPPREDEATRVLSAVEQTRLAATAERHETPKSVETAPPAASQAAPVVAKEPSRDAAPKAPSAEEAQPRRRSLTQEVTSRTRIVVRPAATVPPAARSSGGVLGVLLLMVAAGAGGFIFSQVMNARRARAVHAVAQPNTQVPARLPTSIDGGVRGGPRLSRPPGP